MNSSGSLQAQVEVEEGDTGGPIKRDVLLTNMQLVDVETPIIWHGLQRSPDGILRQALMSPEKEVKAEEKTSSLLSETLFASSGVIMLGEAPIILEESPADTPTKSSPEAGPRHAGGAEPSKDHHHGRLLNGDPLLNQAFETPKKKRIKRRSCSAGDKLGLLAGGVEVGSTGDPSVDLVVPMFAATLGRPSSPQSIEIVADILPTKVNRMKLVRNAGAEFEAAPQRRLPTPPNQSPDILTHDAGSASEYTDHLLSQISGVFPAMSSSQVSSVLSALEPNSSLHDGSPPKGKKMSPEESDGGNFVKLETPTPLSISPSRKQVRRRAKHTATFSKAAAVEVSAGKVSWFKCSSCLYLALEKRSVEAHLAKAHGEGPRAVRPRMRCLSCNNGFHSLQSLKVHLLLDHEVDSADLHGLILACVEANKTWKSEAKSKADKGASEVLGVAAQSSVESSSNPTAGLVRNEDSIVVLPTVPEFSLFETVDKYLGSCNGDSAASKEGDPSPRTAPKEHRGADDEQGVAAPPSKETEEAKESLLKGQPTVGKKPHDIKVEKDIGLKCNMEGCTVRFMYPTNMDYHKKCHKESQWECPECEAASPSWANLSLHLWRVHGLDMELYSCDQCSYKTNSLSKLMNLHRRIHGEERPFLCDLCGKGFKTTKQLRNHKGIHRSKVPGRELECSTCGRTFSEVRMLRHHEDIVHRKLRPYLCSVCGHAAASRSTLRMHHRVHSGEKPYRCSECDYSTSDHNSLRRHKMRHSGAKHYSCPHCPYASIQSSTYKSHLKNKHPGLDEGFMFSCQFCPFRTVKKDNFLSHAASHALAQMGDSLMSTEDS